jgi:hypothetical protein
VKVNPPIAVLSIVGISLLALGLTNINDQMIKRELRKSQCEVVLAYLKGLETLPGKPWLLLDRPEAATPTEDIVSFLTIQPEMKDDPYVKIEIAKAKNATLSPAKLCKNVKAWAVKNKVRIEPDVERGPNVETPEWLIPNNNDEYNWHIIAVSMPVISEDGSFAYMNESQYAGPLAGGGEALEYKKNPYGSWVLLKRRGRYIS